MARVIGIVPLGIGLSVLAFAWSDDFGGGMGVPIFFRLFFSFVALAFVFTGAGILLMRLGSPRSLMDQALAARQQLDDSLRATGNATGAGESTRLDLPLAGSAGFLCPSCNAPLGAKADVSPHGDVKCGHCGRWFNVHGR